MKNKLFCGDNLEFLKQYKEEYKEKVKLIYIDPPYNTKNNHFIFKDNVESGDWLNFMQERLEIAKDFLRDDGVIFISIDDKEYAYLKVLCDDIFGRKNFVNSIVWEKKYTRQNDAKFFSTSHEYILCYAKNKDLFSINLLPRTEQQNKAYKNPDKDPRGVWKSDALSVRTYNEKYVFPITNPAGKECLPPKGSCWRFSKERIQELIQDNRIWFGSSGDSAPNYKRFLSDVKDGLTPMTIWKYDEVGHTGNAARELKEIFDDEKVFDYSKPTSLIKRIVHLSTKDDDIILDFFAGSGTTAQAVMEQNVEDGGNRSFILVQLPEQIPHKHHTSNLEFENVFEICRERVLRTCGNCFAEVVL